MTLLLNIINRDVKLKRAASTGGGEYHGPCPVCGGNDRFRVQPNQGKTGRYACRQCGIHGDGIDYLRNIKGLTFQEACKELDYTPPENTTQAILNRHIDDSWRNPPKERKILKAGNYGTRKIDEMSKMQAETKHDSNKTEPDVLVNDTYEDIPVIHPKVKPDKKEKEVSAFSSWRGLAQQMEKLGCPGCEYLHGQACSGGEFADLVGLMDTCPRKA